jgi:hypothetical protein
MKTITDLAVELCKREGLKKQVDVAQMKEILGHLADIFYEGPHPALICTMLCQCGGKRAKKKAKKERLKRMKEVDLP